VKASKDEREDTKEVEIVQAAKECSGTRAVKELQVSFSHQQNAVESEESATQCMASTRRADEEDSNPSEVQFACQVPAPMRVLGNRMIIAARLGRFIAAHGMMQQLEQAGISSSLFIDNDSLERVCRIKMIYDQYVETFKKFDLSKCTVIDTAFSNEGFTYGSITDSESSTLVIVAEGRYENYDPVSFLCKEVDRGAFENELNSDEIDTESVGPEHPWETLWHRQATTKGIISAKTDDYVVGSVIDLFDEPSAPGNGFLCMAYTAPEAEDVPLPNSGKFDKKDTMLTKLSRRSSVKATTWKGITLPEPKPGAVRSVIFMATLVEPMPGGGLISRFIMKARLAPWIIRILSVSPSWMMRLALRKAIGHKFLKEKVVLKSKALTDQLAVEPRCKMYERFRSRMNGMSATECHV